MVIGIISAMQNEFELIIDSLENKEIKNICNVDFYIGEINNNKINISSSNINSIIKVIYNSSSNIITIV
jgi:nucleoside phosphorylase